MHTLYVIKYVYKHVLSFIIIECIVIVSVINTTSHITFAKSTKSRLKSGVGVVGRVARFICHKLLYIHLKCSRCCLFSAVGGGWCIEPK